MNPCDTACSNGVHSCQDTLNMPFTSHGRQHHPCGLRHISLPCVTCVLHSVLIQPRACSSQRVSCITVSVCISSCINTMCVLLYRLYHAVSCCIVLYHLPKKEIFVLYQLYQYCIVLYRRTSIVLLYQYRYHPRLTLWPEHCHY